MKMSAWQAADADYRRQQRAKVFAGIRAAKKADKESIATRTRSKRNLKSCRIGKIMEANAGRRKQTRKADTMQ